MTLTDPWLLRSLKADLASPPPEEPRPASIRALGPAPPLEEPRAAAPLPRPCSRSIRAMRRRGAVGRGRGAGLRVATRGTVQGQGCGENAVQGWGERAARCGRGSVRGFGQRARVSAPFYMLVLSIQRLWFIRGSSDSWNTSGRIVLAKNRWMGWITLFFPKKFLNSKLNKT
jgi:hypothetical protein